MKHGASAYRKGLCKCEVCTKGHAEYQAAYRKKYGRRQTDSAINQRKFRGNE